MVFPHSLRVTVTWQSRRRSPKAKVVLEPTSPITGDGELRAHAREPSAAPSYAQLLGAEVLPRTPLSHEGLRRLQAVAPGVLAASPGPRPRAEGRAIVVTGRDLPACQPPDH
jgi:hypothetical protein